MIKQKANNSVLQGTNWIALVFVDNEVKKQNKNQPRY